MSEHRRVEITRGEDPYADVGGCACSLCRHTRTQIFEHARRELARVIRDLRLAGTTNREDAFLIWDDVWTQVDING